MVPILMINVYMPCDSNTDGNPNKFTEMLGEVSSVCQLGNTDYVIIWGDFNTDFTRLDSLYARALRGFVSGENLIHVGITEDDNHVYTYESNASSRSFTDHFLISDGLKDNIGTCKVTNEAHNFSDHSCLTLTLSVRAIERNMQTVFNCNYKPGVLTGPTLARVIVVIWIEN